MFFYVYLKGSPSSVFQRQNVINSLNLISNNDTNVPSDTKYQTPNNAITTSPITTPLNFQQQLPFAIQPVSIQPSNSIPMLSSSSSISNVNLANQVAPPVLNLSSAGQKQPFAGQFNSVQSSPKEPASLIPNISTITSIANNQTVAVSLNCMTITLTNTTASSTATTVASASSTQPIMTSVLVLPAQQATVPASQQQPITLLTTSSVAMHDLLLPTSSATATKYSSSSSSSTSFSDIQHLPPLKSNELISEAALCEVIKKPNTLHDMETEKKIE
jgi:hypothetical protein